MSTQIEPLESRRLFSAGVLDQTFGQGGHILGDIDAHRLLVQPNGRIVIGSDEGVRRLNSDGSEDTFFNAFATEAADIDCEALAIQPDGKIVAVGTDHGDFVLARYTSRGQLDTSFNGGRFTTNLGHNDDEAEAVAIQPDGKIVVAGRSGDNFAVARYLANGKLDPKFGTVFHSTTGRRSGKVITDFGGAERAIAIAIDGNGRIIVSGNSIKLSNDPDQLEVDRFAIARYNPDGSLDSSFNRDGKATPFFDTDGGFALGMSLQRNGNILMVGSSVHNQVIFRTISPAGIAGPRTVGDDGIQGRNMITQPNGKVIVAGIDDSLNFLVARYDTNFQLDPNFGNAGKFIDGADTSNGAQDIGMLPGGQIVAGGAATLARIDNDSSGPALDNVVPTAALTGIHAPRSGGSELTFSVTYADNVGIDSTTLGNNNIVVTGPRGFQQAATLVNIKRTSTDAPRTAVYRITAPHTSWSAQDNGLYTATLTPKTIADRSGYTITRTRVGSFQLVVKSATP